MRGAKGAASQTQQPPTARDNLPCRCSLRFVPPPAAHPASYLCTDASARCDTTPRHFHHLRWLHAMPVCTIWYVAHRLCYATCPCVPLLIHTSFSRITCHPPAPVGRCPEHPTAYATPPAPCASLLIHTSSSRITCTSGSLPGAPHRLPHLPMRFIVNTHQLLSHHVPPTCTSGSLPGAPHRLPHLPMRFIVNTHQLLSHHVPPTCTSGSLPGAPHRLSHLPTLFPANTHQLLSPHVPPTCTSGSLPAAPPASRSLRSRAMAPSARGRWRASSSGEVEGCEPDRPPGTSSSETCKKRQV